MVEAIFMSKFGQRSRASACRPCYAISREFSPTRVPRTTSRGTRKAISIIKIKRRRSASAAPFSSHLHSQITTIKEARDEEHSLLLHALLRDAAGRGGSSASRAALQAAVRAPRAADAARGRLRATKEPERHRPRHPGRRSRPRPPTGQDVVRAPPGMLAPSPGPTTQRVFDRRLRFAATKRSSVLYIPFNHRLPVSKIPHYHPS